MPNYWRNESSGVLAPVVRKYVKGESLTPAEIRDMQAYLWQWVKDPCWQPSGALQCLRLKVAAIQTNNDIRRAVHTAVELGMDPL